MAGPGSILVRGGDVVTEDGIRKQDVLLAGGRVEATGTSLSAEGAEVVEATGKLVIPGAVDVHTHLDMEVGVTRSADDFFTGTRAAACGGTTTVIDFATAYRGESASFGLAEWHGKAEGRAVVDYGFHMTVTELEEPAEELVGEMAAAGVTSFKLYMTYPDRLMVPDDLILEVMRACGRAGSLLCLHCEDDAGVAKLRAEALDAGHSSPIWHALTRPPHTEADAVARAIAMAEETGASVYIVHLTCADALDHVRSARERGVSVFAETCPQYLFLSQDRLEGAPEEAADFVCAPPLREAWNQDALWEGLRAGDLQVVSTDHCPFTRADRAAGLNGGGWRDFTEIPGGLPGIETRLSLVYQKVRDGFLSTERWVEVCCSAPAQIFGLWPRKGRIARGADADVCVFDPLAERSLAPSNLHMNVDHSPYADTTVVGWPETVIAGGRVVVAGGEPVAGEPMGRYLPRGRGGRVA